MLKQNLLHALDARCIEQRQKHADDLVLTTTEDLPALPRALSTVRERLERLELPASACLPAACVGRAGSFAYDDGDILV